VECAWAAIRHDGYLKSLYHRHVMKWGGYRSPVAKKKAIIVVAHAMLVIISLAYLAVSDLAVTV
jgi:transposase